MIGEGKGLIPTGQRGPCKGGAPGGIGALLFNEFSMLWQLVVCLGSLHAQTWAPYACHYYVAPCRYGQAVKPGDILLCCPDLAGPPTSCPAIVCRF